MKTIGIVFFAGCGLAFAGVPEGKVVFAAKCQPCHGANGEGKPAIAKMLGVAEMRAFASKEVQARGDAEFKKIVTTGQGKMKPVAGLSDAQIADVIAFIHTLK